jgi:hypothetical protein
VSAPTDRRTPGGYLALDENGRPEHWVTDVDQRVGFDRLIIDDDRDGYSDRTHAWDPYHRNWYLLNQTATISRPTRIDGPLGVVQLIAAMNGTVAF